MLRIIIISKNENVVITDVIHEEWLLPILSPLNTWLYVTSIYLIISKIILYNDFWFPALIFLYFGKIMNIS